ncbi:hypothetical protein Fmac_006222 [Flemingia macrophylla]|uniref:Uncharacterized protein n=1 Tax=Flemingia macrophylla TaxID=520843 RepID=A0ABD1NA06_9FABA
MIVFASASLCLLSAISNSVLNRSFSAAIFSGLDLVDFFSCNICFTVAAE